MARTLKEGWRRRRQGRVWVKYFFYINVRTLSWVFSSQLFNFSIYSSSFSRHQSSPVASCYIAYSLKCCISYTFPLYLIRLWLMTLGVWFWCIVLKTYERSCYILLAILWILFLQLLASFFSHHHLLLVVVFSLFLHNKIWTCWKWPMVIRDWRFV